MQSVQRKYESDYCPYPAQKRVVKMQGNVAYISTDPVGPRPQPQTAKKQSAPKNQIAAEQAKARARASAKAREEALAKERKQSRRSLASTLFVIFVAFCALSLLISRHAVISTIGSENNAIEKNIAAAMDKIDELKVKMELGDSIESLQMAAQQKGMTYPTQDQKITIDLSG